MPGNSYVQPVAGEPSLGTLHYLAANVAILNTDPADTNWHSIDLSAYIPAGAGAVKLYGQWTSGNVRNVQLSDSTGGVVRHQGYVPASNGYWSGTFDCKCSSARLIWWKAENADITNITLTLVGYFI
jgi:hypothetical protein